MSVVNALRLPLGPLTNLGTSPPLIVIDDPRTARVTFEASNTDHDFHGDIDVNLGGTLQRLGRPAHSCGANCCGHGEIEDGARGG